MICPICNKALKELLHDGHVIKLLCDTDFFETCEYWAQFRHGTFYIVYYKLTKQLEIYYSNIYGEILDKAYNGLMDTFDYNAIVNKIQTLINFK